MSTVFSTHPNSGAKRIAGSRGAAAAAAFLRPSTQTGELKAFQQARRFILSMVSFFPSRLGCIMYNSLFFIALSVYKPIRCS
jgi:hypothetical protein